MKKRTTAIIPMYVAGWILLLFAVLPHHHHQAFICFNTSHCTDNHPEKHSHDNAFPVHNSNCINYLLQTDQIKQLSRSADDSGENALPFPLLSFCFLLAESPSVFPYFIPAETFPEQKDDPIPTLLLTSSYPTRGPPALC